MVEVQENESQQYCIKWNRFPDNILVNFHKSLANEHFVDVTLACESQIMKCHKVVLSACSPYFEKMLVDNPCSHPIIFLKDMKYWELESLVQFMYKGEVNILQEQLEPVLRAAESLQIRGLCSENEKQARGVVKGVLPPETVVSSTVDSNCNKAGNQDNDSDISDHPSDVKENGDEENSAPSKFRNNNIKAGEDEEEEEEGNSALKYSSNSLEKRVMGVKLENENNAGSIVDDHNYSVQQDYRAYYHERSLSIDSDQGGPGPSIMQVDEDDGNSIWPLGLYEDNYPHVIVSEAGRLRGPGGVTQRTRRSDAELRSAANSVRDGMTFQEASQAFSIPMSTIRFYMARKGILPVRKRGRKHHSVHSVSPIAAPDK